MPNRPPVICSCGQELPRPIPRVCPHCDAEIRRVEHSRAPAWIPVLLIILMFGSLLALILFLSNYMG